MRHFVTCPLCQRKFYIHTNAKVRSELPASFVLTCPLCHRQSVFTPYMVYAEFSGVGSAGGALLGALLGLAGGGAGAVLGSILGAALGGTNENSENQAVQRFNSS